MSRFESMTGAQLVLAYNAIAKELDEPLVTRFSTRSAGVARCLKIESLLNPGKKPKEPKEPKEPLDPDETAARRSAAIAESWKVPQTWIKRTTRHFVRVDGHEYRSVREAFLKMDLPLKEHIQFRMLLKSSGTLKAYGKTWEALRTGE